MVDPSKPLGPAKVKEYYKTEYSAASNSYFSQSGLCKVIGMGNLLPTSASPDPSMPKLLIVWRMGSTRYPASNSLRIATPT